MRITKNLLLVVGIFAALMGVLWMGQGSGYFPYPRSSFMIDQSPWIYRGLGLAVFGIILIGASRRFRPR